MIKKLVSLKNFGLFADFKWDTTLPEFEQFNLIYGWNRSGKTTLSRVFSSCENKALAPNFKESQFEIELKNGEKIQQDSINKVSLAIKVFNHDFIEENFSFKESKSQHAIVYIDSEAIKEQEKVDGLKKEYKHLEKNWGGKAIIEKRQKEILTSISSSIRTARSLTQYGPDKVNNKISDKSIPYFDRAKIIKDNRILEELKNTIKNPVKNKITAYEFIDFADYYNTARKLLYKEIKAESIPELKNDQVLNRWVGEGVELHQEKQNTEQCLFCKSSLPPNVWRSYLEHFNSNYQHFQEDIKKLISDLETNVLEEINLTKERFEKDLNNFYPEIKAQHQNVSKGGSQFLLILDSIKKTFEEILQSLQKKTRNPFSRPSCLYMESQWASHIQDTFKMYKTELNLLNSNIQINNNYYDDHTKEIEKYKQQLEEHFIAKGLEDGTFNDLNNKLSKLNELDELIRSKQTTLNESYSNKSKAIQRINQHLRSFFGSEEIKLQYDSEETGYKIKRGDREAHHLSEAEKTAIAFSYFIAKTEEENFKIEKTIFFIDDPISSFDADFVYHSFCVIKQHFKGCLQLFISTHNFQFFNLIKEWFINKNDRIKKKNRENEQIQKPLSSEFYMVTNEFTENKLRKAQLIELDPTLKSYKSEYHFLFHLLKKFNNKEQPSVEENYTVGNIARRFLEIFLDFKIPDSNDQSNKLSILIASINKGETFIEEFEKDKVSQIINAFSHNNESSSMVQHTSKNEIQSVIPILFKLIKKADPKHYEILEKQVKNEVIPKTFHKKFTFEEKKDELETAKC